MKRRGLLATASSAVVCPSFAIAASRPLSFGSPETSNIRRSNSPVRTGSTVYFDEVDAELTAQAQRILTHTLQTFRLYRFSTISIVGFADGPEDGPGSLRLSERRAGAVRNWFLLNGIPRPQMQTFACGRRIRPEDAPSTRFNRAADISIGSERPTDRPVIPASCRHVPDERPA